MKKSLMQAIVIAVAATVPVVSFAQASAPVTRGQLKREIARLEQAGYSPADSNIDYPTKLQAAEARIGEEESPAVTRTYGGEIAGKNAAGSRASRADRSKSPYVDNANSLYVGD